MKTVILHDTNGWYDSTVDAGSRQYFASRRLARIDRRARLFPNGKPTKNVKRRKFSYLSSPAQVDPHALTKLQERALKRLVLDLNIDSTEAEKVVRKYGYNAAVSYGHIRRFGATEAEAMTVIDLQNADISLTYSARRQYGYNHTDALHGALNPPMATIGFP